MNTVTQCIDIAGNSVPIHSDYLKYVATIKGSSDVLSNALLCPSGFGHTDPVKHIKTALPIIIEKAEFETLISLSQIVRAK